MKDTVILVLSCDKNHDLFSIFHYCIEKYWPEHPEIYYTTETTPNPYYKTICLNYNIEMWTKRIKETLQKIKTKFVLIMVDDLFLQSATDNSKMCSLLQHMKNDVANINLEPSFDAGDMKLLNTDLLERNPEGAYLNSVMCGLWNKERLIESLKTIKNPWDFEFEPKLEGYKYLITQNGDYLDWGYKKDPRRANWHFGLHRGKWEKNCVEFLSHEGINVDYSVRGIE